MATSTASKPTIPAKLQQYKSDHEAGWRNTELIRQTWYDKERLLIGRLSDQASRKNSHSRVTDSHISTLAWERQMRVCSQLPSGQIYSVSQKDEKAAALYNLVLSKYIQPNANSQFDLLTKLRMTGVNASVYGVQFVLYDYRIEDDYIGPDFWLIPARKIIFQPGKNSVQDCAWVDVETEQNKTYFEGLVSRKSTTWNQPALKKLIDLIQDGAKPSSDADTKKKTAIEDSRTQGANLSSSTPRIELVTRYEKGKKGHWITWAKDYPEAGILRDILNPHNSGKIPIVGRYCFPLLDSIWGLGDFERGITMQKAKDSLINLFLEGVKLSIFPPLKIDIANVTPSTIKIEAGARWLMKDLNAVQTHQSGNFAAQEFNQTYEFMTTALQNQFGTTDTSVNGQQSGNPAFGRTPEALKMLNQRESARDAWDRYMLEIFIQELYEGMINLLGEKQEKPISFNIFDKEIEDIQDQFDDDDDDDQKQLKSILKPYDKRSAKLILPKKLIGGEYQFVIDPSSTKENDDDAQMESLKNILDLYLTNPQLWDQFLQMDSLKFNPGMAFKQLVYGSGVKDPDSLIDSLEDEGDGEGAQNNQQQLGNQPQLPVGANNSQPMVNPGSQPAAAPTTADHTNTILTAIQNGADPTDMMDRLSQGTNPIRDPQAMAAASQILPPQGGNQ